ncbi:hypothetical protein [Microbacterium sp. SSM24]|nr:hypothetical protein [Microbacterium sp. SSM24]MCW3492035.1 hypothetical protein [Microbacterium sp. SSM24]
MRRGSRSASRAFKTVPGRHFLVAFRLYGTEHAFYDQTWKLDDLIKID